MKQNEIALRMYSGEAAQSQTDSFLRSQTLNESRQSLIGYPDGDLRHGKEFFSPALQSEHFSSSLPFSTSRSVSI